MPLLVPGLASAAILSGGGEFSLLWETRGAPLEWGGVYAQGIRLCGPWTLRLTVEGRTFTLPETVEHLRVERWLVQSRHRMGPVEIVQEVFALPDAPAIVRRLTFHSTDGGSHLVSVDMEFEPYLAPVLMEGVKPYVYRVEGDVTRFQLTTFGLGLSLVSNVPPTQILLDGTAWSGANTEGDVRSVRAEYEVSVSAETSPVHAWVMYGGLARTMTDGPGVSAAEAEALDLALSTVEREWAEWISETPVLRLPQAPELEQAYRLARSALRALYTRPEKGLTGLVAGYPWYSSIWCRDLAWMLPAVLWLGDHDWVENSIRAVLRFQARSALPILGAEAGELPMQISPGPMFLYGTSDTSLYYPVVARQLIDHARRPELVKELLPSLDRIGEWARRRAATPLGLFRNGGEIEEVQVATAGVGRITYGFDAFDTTIWDSTDRRDHAIDLQVLFIEALRALADLRDRSGNVNSGTVLRDQAGAAARAILEKYWWAEEGYLYDTLGKDGSGVPKLRPNALLAVTAGLLPLDQGRSVLGRSLQADLSAPWGMRTLSNHDPGFVPTAYHDGQVWTIATAWAARAAFAVGESSTGVAMLRCIADRIIAERGFANECYRGDRPEPFNSCFLLGFSIGPFLTCLFEGLWGMKVGPGGGSISIEPKFPAKWTEADLSGIRVGAGHLDLAYRMGRLIAHWSGPGTLHIHSGEEAMLLAAGGEGQLIVTAPPKNS